MSLFRSPDAARSIATAASSRIDASAHSARWTVAVSVAPARVPAIAGIAAWPRTTSPSRARSRTAGRGSASKRVSSAGFALSQSTFSPHGSTGRVAPFRRTR